MTSLAAIFLSSNNLMVYSPLLCTSIHQYPMLAILLLLLITIISFILGLTIMCCYIASSILELRYPHWHYIYFFFNFFLIEDNCFTILCYFPSYINKNQP
ncbi:unnamed protein product [Rangifer tarandus platyrhynchus]|uniref:Uncharacterized protein n=1 Tax=Rangifer tarandus platyrhynchus TaxID=3082113 RepID=A0AC59Z877_RANTA